jgi:hypothetical protein
LASCYDSSDAALVKCADSAESDVIVAGYSAVVSSLNFDVEALLKSATLRRLHVEPGLVNEIVVLELVVAVAEYHELSPKWVVVVQLGIEAAVVVVVADDFESFDLSGIEAVELELVVMYFLNVHNPTDQAANDHKQDVVDAEQWVYVNFDAELRSRKLVVSEPAVVA